MQSNEHVFKEDHYIIH